MLSSSARPYIDASVPVLREAGLAITQHFYTQMFQEHPELKNLFNMGNQASGVQQQSLAAAVFAYAANHDNPAALAPVIERIVHKHVSVGIGPQHYPIVGRHLLGAIQAVLGEAATPELLAAWDEAYSLLANALIDAEARLYAQAGVTPESNLRPLVVMEMRQESENVRSFYLQTPDGQSPGSFEPGQYVTVAVQLGERRQLRQYSLSDGPDQPWWRISVKREQGDHLAPAGEVSNWLHDHLQPGDTVMVTPAFGDFRPQLSGTERITLLSAGIGITPMVSVLRALIDSNSQRPVLFAHAARHGSHHSLRSDLALAQSRLGQLRTVVFYELPQATDREGTDYQHEGRMDLAKVISANDDLSGDFYLCGPSEFMRDQWRSLLAAGVSPARIHREVFGPELLDHL